MKTNSAENQNTEYAEYQDIRQNTPEHGRTLLFGGMLLAILALSLCRFGAPVYAQIATVTPLPGPVATATEASRNKAEAQRKLDEANRNAATAQEQLNSANQDIANANAAIAAQQIGAALSLIGSANGKIDAALSRITDTLQIVAAQNGTIDRMSNEADQKDRRIADLENENQGLKTDKGVILQNFDALQKQLDEQQSKFSISPTIAIIAGGFFVAIVLIFVAWKWSRRESTLPDPPAAPPLEGEWRQEMVDEDAHD